MKFNIGDEVVANLTPPVMTVVEIVGNKVICEWGTGTDKKSKKYFHTELKPASQLQKPEKIKLPYSTKRKPTRKLVNRKKIILGTSVSPRGPKE